MYVRKLFLKFNWSKPYRQLCLGFRSSFLPQVDRHAWTDFLIISAIAAGSSLVATLLFLHQSAKSYPCLVVNSLAGLREHIETNIDQAFRQDQESPHSSRIKSEKPLNNSNAKPVAPVMPKVVPTAELHRAFARAFLEMHYNRVHVKEIRAFTHIIDRLQTELSCTSVCFLQFSLGKRSSLSALIIFLQGAQSFLIILGPRLAPRYTRLLKSRAESYRQRWEARLVY